MKLHLKCIAAVLVASATQAMAVSEVSVLGVVTSTTYFYDQDGNRKEAGEPFFREPSICKFAYKRRGNEWSINIDHPDPSFPDGSVKRSITPNSEGGFTSVITFPPRLGVEKSSGNAFVNVITNGILPFEDVYGAHALWLVMNLDTLREKYVSSNACPPFWQFYPERMDAGQRTHNVILTNGGVVFWCNGLNMALDEKGKAKRKNGVPEVLLLPPPLDKGFVEAQYIPSTEYLNKELGIPKSATLTYFASFRDSTQASGFRQVPETELKIQFNELDGQLGAETTFVPTWTNAVALVVDPRGHGSPNQALTYVTKSTQLDLSQAELKKQQRKSNFMNRDSNRALGPLGVGVKRAIIVVGFGGLSVGLAVLVLYLRKTRL